MIAVMKGSPCSEWDDTAQRCKSGWIGINSACRGWFYTDCKKCGPTPTPPCMEEVPSKHWLQDNGLPVLWPIRNQPEGGGQ